MSIVKNLNDDYDFDIISFSDGKQFYTDEFLKYGGNIYHFKKYDAKNPIGKLFLGFFEYLHLYKQIKDFLAKHNDYACIHCHNYFNAAPFLKAAARHNIKIRIAHSHNVKSIIKYKNPFHNIFDKIKQKQLVKYATNKIACSKGAGEYLFGKNSLVEVVNNAIDLQKFDPHKFNNKNESDCIKFVHIGRYGYQKNQLFLLDVFNELIKDIENASLTLVGFGLWTDKVKNRIDELKLTDKVAMLPSDTDIPLILSQSDAMIFPSTFEGLGISLIEAQAMGLRCYTSEVIQPEADLGLCKTLELSLGAKKWAEFICDDINKNGLKKQFVDMSSYDIQNIKEQYRRIYSD
ncbi:MAG: glycosyltransferase [Eubacterium sp.]|nr:glycosyltransferase [Eubacterium sp.]